MPVLRKNIQLSLLQIFVSVVVDIAVAVIVSIPLSKSIFDLLARVTWSIFLLGLATVFNMYDD